MTANPKPATSPKAQLEAEDPSAFDMVVDLLPELTPPQMLRLVYRIFGAPALLAFLQGKDSAE